VEYRGVLGGWERDGDVEDDEDDREKKTEIRMRVCLF